MGRGCRPKPQSSSSLEDALELDPRSGWRTAKEVPGSRAPDAWPAFSRGYLSGDSARHSQAWESGQPVSPDIPRLCELTQPHHQSQPRLRETMFLTASNIAPSVPKEPNAAYTREDDRNSFWYIGTTYCTITLCWLGGLTQLRSRVGLWSPIPRVDDPPIIV